MQYLLTQDELDALRGAQRERSDKERQALQALCTAAAEHVPVSVSWRPDVAPAPWGCILSPGSVNHYCDECPAKELCPYKGKKWSQ